MSDEKEKASATVVLRNEAGLHARPASLFVQKAARFKSDIYIIKEEKRINAKSIMGVLSGGMSQGVRITIEAEGDDAQEAVDALVQLVDDNFGEDL